MGTTNNIDGTDLYQGAATVFLAQVLQKAGIPNSGIALILGLDRILDMSRTALNVSRDFTSSLVLDSWVGVRKSYEQQKMDEELWEKQHQVTGKEVICRARFLSQNQAGLLMRG